MNCDVTYEELAALTAGDLPENRAAELTRHLAECERCRLRVSDLARADDTLRGLHRVRPPAAAVLATRRALSDALHAPPEPEVLTLDEAADFLRITPEELGEIAGELPAFELAGRIRIRRDRLIEWIRRRERDYSREAAASWAAHAGAGHYPKGAI